MTTGTWLLPAAGVPLLLLLAWAMFALTRLRRLAGRVRRAHEVLDGALLRRAELAEAGRQAVHAYDWSVVSERILAVYETVAPPGGTGVTGSHDHDVALLGGGPSAEETDPTTASPFRRRVRR